MEWQQDQDPEISVEDVFKNYFGYRPRIYTQRWPWICWGLWGEDYPIFPPPLQELLQQQPTYIPDEAIESEPYA